MKTKDAIEIAFSEEYQTLEQLLKSIVNLSQHIIEDNKISIESDKDFPTVIRQRQVQSITSLSTALSKTIDKISLIESKEES